MLTKINVQGIPTYFNKGDAVRIKWIIDGPVMIVEDIVFDSSSDKPKLLGILCFWFNRDMDIQERVFNSKDLIKLSKDVYEAEKEVKSIIDL